MEHNNEKMSLQAYWLVEKPNKQLKRTLAMICDDSPIICVDKLKNGNIDVWTKESTVEAEDFSERNRHYQRFVIHEVNTDNGEIITSREMAQSLPREIDNFM